ncbi:MAG: peptidyl-prolyl cis-trans isomerase [candidate division WOR-3 bacterium]|nr:MAG: peptidyl-prolyl cis-trans isomerase [candidate division WOR-3 bacterium]
MVLVFILLMGLPQDYVNLIIDGRYEDAVAYCDMQIEKGKKVSDWMIEKADIYLDKIGDYEQAAELYGAVIDKHRKKDGWLYLRHAIALERAEDYLNAAKAYEIVATQYRKAPLDSFSLNGVERCFHKNYQDSVAKVNGVKITRLELDERLSKMTYAVTKDEKGTLEQMILERLIYLAALDNNIAQTEFYKEQFEMQRQKKLLEEMRAHDIVARSEPDERAMKKYYKKNKENYVIRESVRGKEIVVESDSLAEFILDSLSKDMASFDTLAKQYSVLPTKTSGGMMGVVYKGSKPEPVEKALFKAKLDTPVGVIPFDDKFGIYLVNEHTPKSYRDYKSVESQVLGALKNQNMKELEEKLIKTLRKKSKTEIFMESLGDSLGPEHDSLVATVNAREISVEDVIYRNANQPQFAVVNLANPEEFNKFMETMIEENLKLEHAERNKYFLHDGYVTEMITINQRLFENGLYRKIVVDGVQIDSQEVKRFYDEHKEEFRVPENFRCKEIGVETRSFATERRKIVLAKPEVFDSLAREHSILPSGKNGGEVGIIRKGMKSKTYEDAAFKTKAGGFTTVFAENDSLFVFLYVLENNPPTYRSYEDVARGIESRLTRQRQREVADAFLQKIRDEAEVEIYLVEPTPDEATPEDAGDEVPDPETQQEK